MQRQVSCDGVFLMLVNKHTTSLVKHIRGLFLKGPGNFLGPESCSVFVVFAYKIKVSIIFENNTMKLSVNGAKLTGLWARTVLLFNRF